jgi:DNA-binding MarR family transcriptional regulator
MHRPPEPKTLDALLAQVSRLHHHRAHTLLDEVGLYRGQPPVLFILLEQDGLTQRELAERLEITPATMTKMLQRMEKAGFIQRQPDAHDQRVSRVYLTQQGHDVHARLEEIWQQLNTENFEGFNEEEQVVLRSFLFRIRENLLRAIDDGLPVE